MLQKKNIVILVLVALVLGGVALFFSAQLNRNGTQHTAHSGEASSQPVDQSHRSYRIDLASRNNPLQARQPSTLTYTIKNDRGDVVKNFEVTHEKIMHFIVVRKDLQHFLHLHPVFNQNTGEFSTDITFPANGLYRLFPDFTPHDENPQKLPVTVSTDVTVGDTDENLPMIVDSQPRKSVDGYQITSTLPKELEKQKEVKYRLTIEKNDQPVKDLEPYLGALGHSVILKKDTLDFIHTHALEEKTSNEGHGQGHGETQQSQTAGPHIDFATLFPDAGTYKVFTQFQHQGKIITTDYVVRVNE